MCMVIDANSISHVFSHSDSMHVLYRPVLQWFLFGKAKICVGGTKYKKEVFNGACSYLSFFKELGNLGKIHYIEDSKVDELQRKIEKAENNADFDDPHVIALLIASHAKVLCSEDCRSFRFVAKIKQYEKNAEKPLIFTSGNNHDPHNEILCDKNICNLGDHKRLPRSAAKKIWDAIERD